MAVYTRSQIHFGYTTATAPQVEGFIIYDATSEQLLHYKNGTWVPVIATVAMTADNVAIDTIEGITAENVQQALEAINSKAASAYHAQGSKTWEEIQALTSDDVEVGYVYDVSTSFVVDGKTYPAGTNIVCTATDPVTWDILTGFVDLSTYQKQVVADSTASAIGVASGTTVEQILVSEHSVLSGKADAATTLAGYGITDAYTKSEADGKYALISGQEFTGSITAPDITASSTLTLNGATISSITNASDLGVSDYAPSDTDLITASAVYTLIDKETSSFIPNGGSGDYGVASGFSVGTNLSVGGSIVALSNGLSIYDASGYVGISVDSSKFSSIHVDTTLSASSLNVNGDASVSGTIHADMASIQNSLYAKHIDASTANISVFTDSPTFSGSYITYDGVRLDGITTTGEFGSSDFTPSDTQLITAKAVADHYQLISDMSAYVTIAGDETISGKKTFSQEIVASTGINTTTGVTNIGGKVERVVSITDSGSVNLTSGKTKAEVKWVSSSALIEYDVVGSNIYQEIIESTSGYTGGLVSASAGVLSFSGTGTAYIVELG